MAATGHKLAKARRLQRKAALFTLVLTLAAAAAMIWLVVTADGPAWIGRRSHRIPVPVAYVKASFLLILLPFAAALVWGIVRQLRTLWQTREPAVAATGLALGEPVRWRGRPGLHSLNWQRRLLFVAICPLLLVFFCWLWGIWSGSSTWAMKLVDAAFAMMLFGGLIFFVLTAGIAALREWGRDMAGVLVVTDRRIAWLHPWRDEVYRAIDAAAIVDAYLVEQKGRRGWIAVTVRQGNDVTPIDLFGVPRPTEAVAAIKRLIR